MRSKEQLPYYEKLLPLASVLGERFIQRRDVYARQLDDGSYVFVRKPLEEKHLVAHLQGKMTLGAYVLDAESHGRYLVLDADDAPDWRRLKALAGFLAGEGTTSYLEASRRGGHLWLFFDRQLPGKEIRGFGQGLLAYFNLEDLELFPKQDALKGGPGSLVRLPFGVHRKSNRRYGFYFPDGRPLAPTLRGQIQALSAPESVSKAIYDRFLAHWASLGTQTSPERPQRWRCVKKEAGEQTQADMIKEAIPVRQFVLRYVELSPSGKGLCPFHDDQMPSLHVNDDRNFWWCFACEKGGSVIDFYMALQDCDFPTAVAELGEMLFERPLDEVPPDEG
jgi:hypothetical protein